MSSGEKNWKLGVIGGPKVKEYSLSPVMHNAALRKLGLLEEFGPYEAEPLSSEELKQWLSIEAPKRRGFNVTMPHKIGVYQWLKEHGKIGDPKIDHIGAVNTVVVQEGSLVGYNTDVNGFLIPLAESGHSLRGWKVILLGSGGAAHAIAFALEKSGVGHLTIWNHASGNFDRAVNLAKRMNELRGSGEFCVSTAEAETLPMEECQLLVNATSLGSRNCEGEVPVEILQQIHKNQLIYDIVYDPAETLLIQAAINRKILYIEGWQMLAGQGAISFYLWTGKQSVDIDGTSKSVFQIMREALAHELSHRTEGRAG